MSCANLIVRRYPEKVIGTRYPSQTTMPATLLGLPVELRLQIYEADLDTSEQRWHYTRKTTRKTERSGKEYRISCVDPAQYGNPPGHYKIDPPDEVDAALLYVLVRRARSSFRLFSLVPSAQNLQDLCRWVEDAPSGFLSVFKDVRVSVGSKRLRWLFQSRAHLTIRLSFYFASRKHVVDLTQPAF